MRNIGSVKLAVKIGDGVDKNNGATMPKTAWITSTEILSHSADIVTCLPQKITL